MSNSLSKIIGGRELVISHPERIYFPEEGITKAEVLAYYEAVWPYMKAHLKDRPVTLHVYPRGIRGFSFYRRDVGDDVPPLARSVPYRELSREKTIQLLLVDELYTLLWLVARGALEWHLWACRVEDFEHPDVAIFDLDAAADTPFERVLEVSLLLRESLEKEGHAPLVKTSGGTGMHVYVPLKRKQDFEEVRNWVKSIGSKLAARHPKLVLNPEEQRKTHAQKRVAVDYAQNSLGKNTAAPYTLRARPDARVSAPLSWKEVETGGFHPSDFTLRSMPARLEKVGDLFSFSSTNYTNF